MSNTPYAELAELAGGFIHDIKNHLSTLGLNLQLLSEDFSDPQSPKERRSAERVGRMQGECQRLVDLANDFLRFARVKDLQRTPVDLRAVVDDLIDFFGPTAKQHAIAIKSYVPAGLPLVALDRTMFEQGLLNLLLNAQQAMPEGGEIILQAATPPGEVVLSLIDTGKGMAPEVLSRAFQPFYSTRSGGTGLGLPTTKRIIEAHGGTLMAESAPGKGTRFTIHLPAVREADGSAASAPLCVLDGVRMPLTEAKVPVLDRGFLFGDGIYEVLRLYAGKPWLEDDHFGRLERSLAVVRIEGIDLGRLRREMVELIADGRYRDGIVYIQITRGVAPRAHPFPAGARPTVLMWAQETGDSYAAKREAGVMVSLQPDLRWKRCDVKSVNLLGNVLANQAAKEAGGAEAVLYTPDGTITEASHSSFFGVVGGTIRTTELGPEILPGVTRLHTLRLIGRLGLPVELRSLRRDELASASELFLSGTSMEIGPVVSVDGVPVADGKPGPITRQLQAAFRDEVRRFVEGGAGRLDN
ncbi:MAG: aminotransferase class IV [Gemmataceae bacterium]